MRQSEEGWLEDCRRSIRDEYGEGREATEEQQDNRLPEAFFSRNAPCPASGAD
ncbi:hypothetical protein NBRC13296_24660 [Paenibacillus chitinolyticus]|uniref:hypothetical protein n=1 Tax=Paenibacillus chitinolyticus TaxID=79263 RepID=UPI003558DAEA